MLLDDHKPLPEVWNNPDVKPAIPQFKLELWLACEKDETKSQAEWKILGGINFQYLKPANAYILAYVVVADGARGSSLTVNLGMAAAGQLHKTAAKYGHPEGPVAMFVEIEDPLTEAVLLGIEQGHKNSGPIPETPEKKLEAARHVRSAMERIRSMEKMSVRVVPGLNYRQPPLSSTQSPAALLLGAVFLPNSKMENGSIVLKTKDILTFLEYFHMEQLNMSKKEIYIPSHQTASFLEMVHDLNKFGDKVALVPFSTSYKLPAEYANLLAQATTTTPLVNGRMPSHSGNSIGNGSNGELVPPRHIVVIGAGISGLTCARTLLEGNPFPLPLYLSFDQIDHLLKFFFVFDQPSPP